MIRVLIADDETSACNNMIRCIDWDKYGIQIVGVAADGLSAYQMILELHPDLVLIDIEMPGMSGIEVIEKVNSKMPYRPSFIIISGYSDFAYAQQAVELDVDQYLLKPFLPSHLLNAIHRSVEKLEIIQERKALPSWGDLSNMFYGEDIRSNFNYPAKEERQIIKTIQAGSFDDIDDALVSFWDKVAENCPSEQDQPLFALLLSISIIHLLFDYGIFQLPNLSSAQDSLQDHTKSRSFIHLHQLSHIVAELLQNVRAEPAVSPALKAASYISEHYQEDINLDSVSQAIYVSPSYLSTCFSQTMGVGFVQFLHQTRIDHAKELLRNTNLKINEIAKAVGYSNSKYFAQVFKKFTQRTPGEYRAP